MTSYSRNNISEFIPLEQRATHVQLMNDYAEFKIEKEEEHEAYECLLMVEREVNGVKLKSVEAYNISVRVYYENEEGFNYICGIC